MHLSCYCSCFSPSKSLRVNENVFPALPNVLHGSIAVPKGRLGSNTAGENSFKRELYAKLDDIKTNDDLQKFNKKFLGKEPPAKQTPITEELYHDIELNFDPAAAEEAGEVTKEKKKEGKSILFWVTVGFFSVMGLMQLFCVVLYFISYVYLTSLVSEIGDGITFEPNSYQGNNGTFHNIHPNISPVLTAFFTPALLLITAVIQCFLIIAEGIIAFSIYRSKRKQSKKPKKK